VPAAVRVAVLLNPAEVAIAAANLRDVETAARAMALDIKIFNARTSGEIDATFAAIARERADAVFISSGPLFTSRRVQLAHLATHHRIPAIHGSRFYPEVDGLISYGASVPDAHRQAGVYVGRILKGAKPADLPVVQMSKFELVINHQTARLIGSGAGVEVASSHYAITSSAVDKSDGGTVRPSSFHEGSARRVGKVKDADIKPN
jgi:putative tryptophan/tyrosine transport system substrate-binding protein